MGTDLSDFVDTVGIPYVKSLCPTELVGDLEIHTKVTTQHTPFPWLYSPFQKKEKKKFYEFPKGEFFQVKVEFSNPSGFELQVQQSWISISGAQYESPPISFVIPASTNSFTIQYSVKIVQMLNPDQNLAKIRGIFVRIFNFLCEHPINENGIGISIQEFHACEKLDEIESKNPQPKKQQKIFNENIIQKPANLLNMIPSMPLLTIQSNVLFMLGGVTDASPTLDSFVQLETIHGQGYPIDFFISNVSDVSATFIEVSHQIVNAMEPPLFSNYELVDEETNRQMDDNYLVWEKGVFPGGQVPLKPTEKAEWKVVFYPKVWMSDLKIEVRYGLKENVERFRKITIHVCLKVKEGPGVMSFDVMKASQRFAENFWQKKKKKKRSLHQGLVLEHSKNLKDDFFLVVVCIENPLPRPLKLTIEYHPPHQDLVSLHEAFITNTDETTKRIFFPLPRFTLDSSLMPAPKDRGKQYIKPSTQLTLAQEQELKLLYWYKAEILKMVKIHWSAADLEQSGELELFPRFWLTGDMLPVMMQDNIKISFSRVENFGVKKELSKKASIDEFETQSSSSLTSSPIENDIEIFYCQPKKWSIFNIEFSSKSKNHLEFQCEIRPFQDYENGTKDFDLTGKLFWDGLLEFPMQLDSSSTVAKEFAFCFPHTGSYKVTILCKETVGSKNVGFRYTKTMQINVE